MAVFRSGSATVLLMLLVLAAAGSSWTGDVLTGRNQTGTEPSPARHDPDPHHGTNSTNHKKAFPVLDFNYENVRTPFEISMWILLALLMKLGESEKNPTPEQE